MEEVLAPTFAHCRQQAPPATTPPAAPTPTPTVTTTTTSPANNTHFLPHHHQHHQQRQQQKKRAISSPRSVLTAWPESITTTTITTMATGFPAPDWTRGHRVSPSPFVAGPGSNEQGSFMLASASSGRRWHVIDAVRPCLYGSVLRAVEVESSPFSGGGWGPTEQRYFAIKQMSLERISRMEGSANEDPLKEIAALQYLKANGPHPNMITVTEVLRDAEYMYVIMPFCAGGELFNVVSEQRGLNEDAARHIFRGLLAGMAFLHDLQICHRDMSLENILLDGEGRVQIIDFGMALMVDQPQRHQSAVETLSEAGGGGDSRRSISPTGPCGKKHYMAPEVAMNDRAFDGFAVDVWACGVVLFITLAGIPPFHIPNPMEDQRCHVIAVQRRLLQLVRRWNLPISEEAIDLIQSCLLFNPSERASIHDLQRHPWLAQR